MTTKIINRGIKMRNVWKVVIIVGLLICFYVVANSFETKYTITYKGSDGSVLATEQLNYEGFDSPPSRRIYLSVGKKYV